MKGELCMCEGETGAKGSRWFAEKAGEEPREVWYFLPKGRSITDPSAWVRLAAFDDENAAREIAERRLGNGRIITLK